MFIEAKLVLKSYKPLKLEKGMLFLHMDNYGFNISELNNVPYDMETYVELNGYPVELFIVYEGNPNLKEFEVLAQPNQIGWFDKGNESDELSDITFNQINDILSNDQGYLALEWDEEEDKPLLFNDKVIIRALDDIDDDNEEFDDDDDDELYYYHD